MRGSTTLVLLLGALIALGGCAIGTATNLPKTPGALPSRVGAMVISGIRVPVIPPQGLFWTHVQAPVRGVTGKPQGPKTGEATVHAISTPPLPGIPSIKLFSWGDASEDTAIANGGITDVTGVDYESRVILMFYRKFTLKVHGD